MTNSFYEKFSSTMVDQADAIAALQKEIAATNARAIAASPYEAGRHVERLQALRNELAKLAGK